ncbi:DinB family protein [Dactylosporangium cerinum]|uniref:DinB family protein n=1 Tax=Dactylosporangium cerinum TaxID=1434730 RepID=A0ABV9WF26_9ACTN
MATDTFSTATERDALCGFLDQARDALIRKADGLSDQDARTAATVSSLSLLSLLKHSAVWERRWFQVIFAGRSFPDEWPAVADEGQDATFALTDDDTVQSVVAYYLEQIEASREIVAAGDLDARCARADLVDENLRWVAVHLIQETARHTGHADIIREAVDGSRGL